MNKSHLIKKQLDKIGSQAYLKDDEWTSMPFNACVFHLWRKSRSNFEPDITEIGKVNRDYYLYIGPANHDITALSGNALLIIGDEKFVFKKRDAVKTGDEIIYYTAAVRRIREEAESEAS